MAESGRLFVVATPIGNLEDITVRALNVLRSADVIAAEDTRRTRALLTHFEIEARIVLSLFAGNEAKRTEELLARLAAGETVAVVTDAGTPVVSDPGERLVRAAAGQGVIVCAIPGASATLTALVASGLPASEFRFCGFPPRGKGSRREALGLLASECATLIFFEAPPRVGATLADMVEAFGGDRAAALCRELTKVHEEVVRAPLSQLAARYASQPPRGECTLVVSGAPRRQEPQDIDAAVRALLAQGLGPKQVAQRLVARTGLPRRQIYQLALALADE